MRTFFSCISRFSFSRYSEKRCSRKSTSAWGEEKDATKDQNDLNASYDNVAAAYRKIFKRMGLSTISVKADTGSMGGFGSEEFMVESPVGDDTLLLCPNCDYAANVEKAACKTETPLNSKGEPQKKTDLPSEEVATPNVFSIEDMENFFALAAAG